MSIASYLGLWITAFLGLSAHVQDIGAQAKWGLEKIWKHAHDQGHLPELSEPVHKPGQDNSVAICATMRDENSTDVREWLLYYRWLGVEHVYLTENAPRVPPQMAAGLSDFVSSGFLTLATEPLQRAQTKVYYDCMRQHYHKHNWLMFFDMDEYLVITEQPEQKLPDFLDAYKEYAGLSVHWIIVGPSGHEERAGAGGVLRSYTQCNKDGSKWVKTIANTFYLANIAYHPHNFEFRDGMRSVDEEMLPIPDWPDSMFSTVPPARSAAAPHSVPLPVTSAGLFQYTIPGCVTLPAVFSKIALYHYITKSRQDFVDKRSRGSGTSKVRTWDEFDEVVRTAGTGRGLCLCSSASHKGGVCRIPANIADKCCPERDFVLRT